MTSRPISEITFMVLDFETVTPAGRPPEPIEIAALFCRLGDGPGKWRTASAFMRPDQGASVTGFDTAQTGIRQSDVDSADPVGQVFGKFDAIAEREAPFVIVAQNASYERNIVVRYSADCPVIAGSSFVDTVLMAKALLPGLTSYRLDSVRDALGIPIQAGRHRALPDVELTARVLRELIRRWTEGSGARTLRHLTDIAGLKDRSTPPEQVALF